MRSIFQILPSLEQIEECLKDVFGFVGEGLSQNEVLAHSGMIELLGLKVLQVLSQIRLT